MSSEYSCSPEDDFFQSLDQSLTIEYSSQMMSNFISDLLVAISKIDDDPEEGFIFNDDETAYSNSCEYFTLPSSQISPFDGPRQLHRNEATGAGNINISFDMFDDEVPQNIMRKNESNLANESDNISVDMFAEFQSDIEVMDVDCSDKMITNEFSNVIDFENKLKTSSDHYKQLNINRSSHQEFPNDLEVAKIANSINGHSNVEFTQNINASSAISKDEVYLYGCPSVDIPTKEIFLQQQIESEAVVTVEKIESEKLNQSIDVLLRVPSNVSYSTNDKSTYCELYENDRDLSVALETSQIARQSVQRTYNKSEIVHVISSTKEKFSLQGCGSGSGSVSLSNLFIPVDETTNKSMHNSSTCSGLEPIGGSSRNGSDLNSTICEEYDFLNNFRPEFQRPTSRSSNLQGLSPTSSIRQRAMSQNSIRCASQNSDLNTTLCEEFEMANSIVAEMNPTQVNNFNFEQAYSQCFLESQVNTNADRRQSFIEQIEKLILKLKNDLVCGRKLEIHVPYTASWDNCEFIDGRLSLRPLSAGRVVYSKRRIALILYVLSFIYKLLLNNKTCTKREIYYSDPELTQNQAGVDNAVLDICYILNARPWEIGILSSSKGLIAGSIKLTLNDDTILDVASIDGGILLPHLTMSIKKVETAAKFVLLVEKHTIYEKLLIENILSRLGPCLLVTGKGYPDINTRVLLKKIWDDCKCPIYALVDADPFGIEIMLSYRHGSMNMSFCSKDLAIPSIRWIGVYPSEIKNFSLQSVPLTKEDVSRIDSMIKRPYISTRIYEELLILKNTLQKAEVEALASSGIVDWIDSYLFNKIRSGVLI